MLIGWKGAGSDRAIASLRYRVAAPLAALRARGQPVELFDPARADAYNAVVLAKAYGAKDRELARAVKARGARVVFDLCDNHFHNPYALPRYQRAREELLEMLDLADVVTCTTPAMAEVIREEAPLAAEPIVIGDVVEKLDAAPPALDRFEGLRLLWFGSHGSPNAPSGMADLLLIERQLTALRDKTPVQLVVCSNDRGKYERLVAPLNLDSRYLEWDLTAFPGVLAACDAVILPISRNPFTACKSHNRLSLSLYAGVPVIADAIDSYLEFAPFCTLDDWDGGMERLAEQPEQERQRALAARDHIDRNWAPEALAPLWEQALGLDAQREPKARSARSSARVSCQGAIDPRADGAITGWLRVPADPDRRLSVRLEADGRVLAEMIADLPRPDLERAGMPGADCGFSLPFDGAGEGSCRLIAPEVDWAFDEPPFQLVEDGRPGLKLAFARRAAASPFFASEGAKRVILTGATSGMAVQDRVLAELEKIGAQMADARQAAARLVIAAGDEMRPSWRPAPPPPGAHGPRT